MFVFVDLSYRCKKIGACFYVKTAPIERQGKVDLFPTSGKILCAPIFRVKRGVGLKSGFVGKSVEKRGLFVVKQVLERIAHCCLKAHRIAVGDREIDFVAHAQLEPGVVFFVQLITFNVVAGFEFFLAVYAVYIEFKKHSLSWQVVIVQRIVDSAYSKNKVVKLGVVGSVTINNIVSLVVVLIGLSYPYLEDHLTHSGKRDSELYLAVVFHLLKVVQRGVVEQRIVAAVEVPVVNNELCFKVERKVSVGTCKPALYINER